MNVIKLPNIPNKKVSKVITDFRINKQSEATLKNIGISLIKTVNCKDTYEEICGHADIQSIYVGDNNIIVAKNVYNEYLEKLKNININVIKGNSSIQKAYPQDIQYNACIIGNLFVHNLKYTDSKLLEYVKEKYKLINVKQGYTKCSISIVNENSIITTDIGIEKELSKYLNVLYLENETEIKLGKMQGFIGGATGLVSNDIWCINGDINKLKNANKIIDFMNLNKMKILCLNKKDVVDIGSIIPIEY